MRRMLLLLVPLAVTFWLCGSPATGAAQQAQTHPTAQHASADKPAEFAGSETCALCHSDIATKFASNPHSKLALMHGGKGVTCESCHGSGLAHIAAGGDPTKIRQLDKMPAKQVDATCLGCHATAHPNFLRSDHAKAGVGCESCHSIHGPAMTSTVPVASAAAAAATPGHPATAAAPAAKKLTLTARFFDSFKPDANISDPLQMSVSKFDIPGENPKLLRASQPQLCFSCHSDLKPAFNQPFHHKVIEGLMKCTDCHDSHGTFNNNQLRSTADQNQICTKCHTETRGPFVFEHAAVKTEGCVGCHSPHGSQNARLLNVPNINQMCNQCHSPVAAGTIHGQGAGSAEVQSCINCHTMVHGSNINPALIR